MKAKLLILWQAIPVHPSILPIFYKARYDVISEQRERGKSRNLVGPGALKPPVLCDAL